MAMREVAEPGRGLMAESRSSLFGLPPPRTTQAAGLLGVLPASGQGACRLGKATHPLPRSFYVVTHSTNIYFAPIMCQELCYM